MQPTDIRLHKFICTVDNGSSTGPGDPVVVSLADPANGRDAGLHQEVLGKVRHSLLRDHQVWFQGNDLIANLLDKRLLHSQDFTVGRRQADWLNL